MIFLSTLRLLADNYHVTLLMKKKKKEKAEARVLVKYKNKKIIFEI